MKKLGSYSVNLRRQPPQAAVTKQFLGKLPSLSLLVSITFHSFFMCYYLKDNDFEIVCYFRYNNTSAYYDATNLNFIEDLFK